MTRVARIPEDIDPYEMLRVPRNASLDEIRRAYRKEVLKAHPDKNPDRAEWSERRTRDLLRAFEILRDNEKRRVYDLRWKLARTTVRHPAESDLFFFRKDDPQCLALRVLHYLLTLRGDDAVDLVRESENALGDDFLRDQLDRADYLDCLFLLGEHLLKRKRYGEALERFVTLYRIDHPARFRRHYFDLAVEYLKSLYLRHLPKTLPSRELIGVLESALQTVRWSRKESARLHLVLAKAHRKVNAEARARKHLEQALVADPGFSRAKRWAAAHLA